MLGYFVLRTQCACNAKTRDPRNREAEIADGPSTTRRDSSLGCSGGFLSH